MNSLDTFKDFMVSNEVPSYVWRYCSVLDEYKWQWFYLQMKEPMEFVTDIDYLFYILKWILKQDFNDLSYSVFFQDIMDPECRPESLIKNKWWPILQKRYLAQLQNINSTSAFVITTKLVRFQNQFKISFILFFFIKTFRSGVEPVVIAASGNTRHFTKPANG